MIEIVIKIPEGLKDVFENRNVTALDVEEMRMAIKNGTPLPEGNGRLIDAPTIVEADKGVLEKINKKQDSLRATCKAWDEAISRDGYVD